MKQYIWILAIEALIMLIPLICVFFDFRSGIRKAKLRGEKIVSSKMRNTPLKIARYYNAMLPFFFIDLLQCVCCIYANVYCNTSLPVFPFFTLLASIGIAIIEIKSILEPANEKESKEYSDIAQAVSLLLSYKTHPGSLDEIINKLKNNDSNNK